MKIRTLSCAFALAFFVCVRLAAVPVPNADFQLGRGAEVPGWSRNSPEAGGLTAADQNGNRSLFLDGTGKQEISAWQSQPLPLQTGKTYRISFWAKGENLTGKGSCVTGPLFANVDLLNLSPNWQYFSNVFVMPAGMSKGATALRLGHWMGQGRYFWDDLRIDEVQPLYARIDDIELGEGERIHMNEYSFLAPFESESRTHARPLVFTSTNFNTNRLRFHKGAVQAYCFEIAGKKQLTGRVKIEMAHRRAGKLLLQVSSDGKNWRDIAERDSDGTLEAAVPEEFYPAERLFLRMGAVTDIEDDTETGSGLGAFQVYSFQYNATLSGVATALIGSTRFVAVDNRKAGLETKVLSLGDAIPGQENFAEVRLRNRKKTALDFPKPATISSRQLAFGGDSNGQDGSLAETTELPRLEPGESAVVKLPYRVNGSGNWEVVAKLDERLSLRFLVNVADYFAVDYGELLSDEGGVALWSASAGRKIPRNRAVPETNGFALELSLAANEAEGIQLILRPDRALSGVRATVSDLKNAATDDVIPAEQVELLRVCYHDVVDKTDETGAVASWPDALPPIRKKGFDCAAGENQPIWIRIFAPKETPAGRYEGMVSLEAADGWRAQIPLNVEVFDFALPDTLTCQTAFGLSKNDIERYHGLTDIRQKRAVFEKYLALFAKNHISPYNPTPYDDIQVRLVGDPAKPDTLDIDLDFRAWDREMKRVLDKYGFNSFQIYIRGVGGGTFATRAKVSFMGVPADNPAFDRIHGKYLRLLDEHLVEKGWDKIAYTYTFDEPEPKDYPYVMEGLLRVKKYAPHLRRMLTEQVEEPLVGGPNLWCPLTMSHHIDSVEARRAAGDDFWWYVCTVPKAPYATEFIDHPATDMRVWLWQTWKYNIGGILMWQANYWTSDVAYPDPKHPQNPYLDPMGWQTGYGTPAGTRSKWGNGDGRFVYPPEAAASGAPGKPILDPPASCIRLEMTRDGLEDYEYFVILKRLLAEKRAALSREDIARYEELLTVPAEVTTSLTNFTTAPESMDAHREKLARAIEELQSMN